LTVGSAVGAIRELFLKLKAIDAKHGSFDFALCTGDFFGLPKEENAEEDEVHQLLSGKLEGLHLAIFDVPIHDPTVHTQRHSNVISCRENTLCQT
jgi:hypothetical protein